MFRLSVKCSVLVLAMLSPVLWAQEAAEEDLEAFLKAQLAIASKIGTTAREAPGVVSLITREEIEATGARDLMDVLRLVPGFELGVDVQGVIGPAVRGNWAHEGKVLLLIDGVEMNEPLFSTIQLGNHFPVAHIERIEIIRGPGSVIYGGFAELAVINIITRSGADLKGGFVSLTNGEMSDAFARRRLDFGFGWSGGTTSLTVLGGVGAGNRSDQTYTDFAGDSYEMGDASKLDGQTLNMALDVGKWRTRFILDRYMITQRDEFGENLPRAVDTDFISWFLDSTYTWQASGDLLFTPRLTYKRQTPWRERHVDMLYDKTVDRYGAGVTAIYERAGGTSILSGIEYSRDRATASSDTAVEDYFPNGKREIAYNNVAVFAQGQRPSSVGTFTVGGRFEKHSEAGNSFVPRLAFTTLRGPWHLKALVSRAFRAPSIENIRLGNDIRPERTTVFELEGGYQLSASSLVTANAYKTTIRGPIVYTVDPVTSDEGYENFDRTGSQGFDLEYRLRSNWGWLTTAYSYSVPQGNEVELYDVPVDGDYALGLASHKFMLSSSIEAGRGFRVSPTIVYYGRRYGYTSADADGNPLLAEVDASTLVNVYVSKSGLFHDRIDLGLGVFDLLGENFRFLQPYNSGHAPLPDASREIVLRITFRMGS